MAQEAIENLLKQGVRSWNTWRAEHPGMSVDLSGGALRGMDFSGFDLSGVDLSGADLRGANLSSANLVGADLVGANLFKAIINRADLNEADLRGVQFLQCPQLESAHNWQSAYRDEDLACGAAIPDR